VSEKLSDKIVPLRQDRPTIINDPCPIVIEFVEKLLKEARKGEFSMMAVAFVRPNGRVGSDWTICGESFRLLASVDLLHYDFIKIITQSTVIEPNVGEDENEPA
jgi:hypothetical protein